MFVWILFLLLFIGGPFTGRLPFILERRTKNKNNILFITMKDPAFFYGPQYSYVGTRGAEIGENWIRWGVSLVLGLLLVPFFEYWVLPFLFVALNLWTKIPYLKRQLKLLAHSLDVFIVSKTAQDSEVYARALADRLIAGYPKMLKAYTTSRLVNEFSKRLWFAKALHFVIRKRLYRDIPAVLT